MGNKRMYKATAADFITAAIVLLLCVVPVFSFAGARAGKTAYIYLNGRQAEKVALNTDRTIKLHNMEIEVRGGRVRVAKSDCPHQICAHTGWISSPAQTIVCVPNKVLVEIRNDGAGQEYNAVSY